MNGLSRKPSVCFLSSVITVVVIVFITVETVFVTVVVVIAAILATLSPPIRILSAFLSED